MTARFPTGPLEPDPDEIRARDRETWTTTGGDVVHLYMDVEGLWRWRVQAGNGENVGSGEAHPDRRDAEAAALRHHPRVSDE